jgi:hypothetical protein
MRTSAFDLLFFLLIDSICTLAYMQIQKICVFFFSNYIDWLFFLFLSNNSFLQQDTQLFVFLQFILISMM